ncbi:response regulator [Spongiibacter taiwanensis]|uniref:response regulator n=1 Tax=Spongiibacter taiwanensis TaxID=1748242 RepID=UPI0020353FF1|nr:response regulator [Spongiibacter taiwanensis]USA44065.1 response regulator [Spongiibacter taiwanensis]
MLNLMIVDDSNIIRSKIQRACDSKRFDVVAVARDGREALTLAHNCKPDVVTMDLTMPNLDGIGCISALSKMLPEVLILVVSALSDEATGIEALERGASGFLLKPFSEAQLRDALDALTDHLG